VKNVEEYPSLEEFEAFIKFVPADFVAETDYVINTGEVVLEIGRKAETSKYSPAYLEKRKKEAEIERIEYVRKERIYTEPKTVLDEEIEKFVSELEIEPGYDLSDVAPDLAESFFSYIGEEDLEEILDYAELEKEDIRSIVADRIASI